MSKKRTLLPLVASINMTVLGGPMQCELEDRLRDFDGVAITILSEARAEFGALPNYIGEVLRLCANPCPEVSSGATWILKAEADDGTQFDAKSIDPLVAALDDVPCWQAELHILQSVEAFRFTRKQARRFFVWATSLAEHPRPFVRAWSLHARVIIGINCEELLPDAKSALSAADCDPAASVRARARNLKNQMQNSSKTKGYSRKT